MKYDEVGEGIGAIPQDDSPQPPKTNPDRRPKPPLGVRIWRSLWRRRIFRRHAPHRPTASRAEIITICVTVAIVLVGVIQAFIYWEQESIMEDSLKQTGAQLALANRNTKTAQDSLTESKRIAKEQETLSTQSFDAAVKQFQLDQRAWLGIDKHGVDVGQKKMVLIVKNTGKTPALDVSLTWLSVNPDPSEYFTVPALHKGIFADYDEWLTYWNSVRQKAGKRAWKPESSPGNGVIAPGATASYYNPLPSAFFLLVKITYNDVFKSKMRTTKLCFVPSTDGVEPCRGGNWMD